jgi:hypothetical protein
MAQKVSSELRPGDVVGAWGMRVKLNEVSSTEDYQNAEGLRREGKDPRVFWSVGTVLNLEEVLNHGLVPRGWMGTDKDGNPTWQIQGNDRATWNVED